MRKYDLSKMEILPESDNPIFDLREQGITHTPFQAEIILFQFIKLGDVEHVKLTMENYLNHGLVVGRLSKSEMKQMQYWAVACISVSIHYAILGGLDETDAYNVSDQYIRQVDSFTSVDSIIPYLTEKALELTTLVYQSKRKAACSPAIKHCLHYINVNLHNKITIKELAKECNLSTDYLSSLFKREMGMNASTYIMKAKLEASKVLLDAKLCYSRICYNFAFCSETHYITCFKKEYRMTPREYVNSLNY